MIINALHTFANSKLKAPTLLILRLLLAIFGGFTLPLVLCVFVPQLLHALYKVDVAPILVWMMLIAFAFYTLIIIWVLSTKKLIKTAVILISLTCLLSIASNYLLKINTAYISYSQIQEPTF